MTTSERAPARSRRRGCARRLGAVAIAATVGAVALAGCSSALPPTAAKAPVLSVVTGLYPLAQAAEVIGGAKVAVSDLVPPGHDPITYQPAPQQVVALRQAGLFVDVGGGFQPALEAAASGARRVVSLAQAGGSSPYVWLDPPTMGSAVAVLAGAMEAADPEAAPLFKQNAAALAAEIASTGMDFSSTLSACPRTTFFTADAAFTALAADYGLHDRVIGAGTSQNGAAALAAEVRSAGVGYVLSDPWGDDSGVAAVAAAAHVRVRILDTLAGVPAGGWPAGATYLGLMEHDLGVLSGVLGCPTASEA